MNQLFAKESQQGFETSLKGESQLFKILFERLGVSKQREKVPAFLAWGVMKDHTTNKKVWQVLLYKNDFKPTSVPLEYL